MACLNFRFSSQEVDALCFRSYIAIPSEPDYHYNKKKNESL